MTPLTQPTKTPEAKLERAYSLLALMDEAGTDHVDVDSRPFGFTTRHTRRQVLELIACLEEKPKIAWAAPVDEFRHWKGEGVSHCDHGTHYRAHIKFEGVQHSGPRRVWKSDALRDVEILRKKLVGGNHPYPIPVTCAGGHLRTKENTSQESHREGDGTRLFTRCVPCKLEKDRITAALRRFTWKTETEKIRTRTHRSTKGGGWRLQRMTPEGWRQVGAYSTREEAKAAETSLRDGVKPS